MATSRTRKRPRNRRFDHCVAKPRGVLHPRVQQVGPEHFGIVCFDCAKVRFQQRTVQAVLDWAAQAAPGDVAADQHLRIALAYYRDRRLKSLEI